MPLTHHSHAGSRYVADAAGVRTFRHAVETSWGVCAIDIFSCSGSVSRTNCDTCAPFSPWPSKTPKRAICEGDRREIGGRSAGDRREIGGTSAGDRNRRVGWGGRCAAHIAVVAEPREFEVRVLVGLAEIVGVVTALQDGGL